jgi:RNA polymerase sigma factor (sigma-70 family)
MRDDPTVVTLVERAGRGDQAAWDQIVERYAPLVWSMCRRFRLADADADDVGATVWLRLVERLDTIAEPAALPGWIATTTRNECLRVLRARTRQVPLDGGAEIPDRTTAPSDEWLLTEERRIALRAAFDGLSERCRRLLSLLFTDPPVPYVKIAELAGIPVGGIGPSRMRCLRSLRRSEALLPFDDRRPTVGRGRPS